jgi:hypothetical protein
MILYLTSCGCKVPDSGIKRLSRKVDGKWTQRLRCITCGKEGVVLARQNTCVDCGIIFEKQADASRIGEICDICSYDRTKIRSKAQSAKIRRDEKILAKNRAINKIDSNRGDYCKGALSCTNYPACLDCNKFYPIFQGVDPGRMEQWTL